MWKEKEACWTKLASEFNSQGLLISRTVGQLQLKYKNMKKVVWKKVLRLGKCDQYFSFDDSYLPLL